MNRSWDTWRWLTFISAYGVFFPMRFLDAAEIARYYTNTSFPMFDDRRHQC